MRFLKYILLPIQIIYSIIILIRNILYNIHVLKTYKVSPLIISVGNIKNGGTGKTPMVEYIIKLFEHKEIAVLSRGHGRKTKKFVLATKETYTAHYIGDESSQLYHKFPNIMIATDTDRVNGVQQLLAKNPKLEIVILDDGYQHRKIQRDINILLTEYDKLLTNDCLMPIGSLREHKKEIKRADIVIITKCPKDISKQKIGQELKLVNQQNLYYSEIKKYNFIDMDSSKEYRINTNNKHVLLTGIENPKKLLTMLLNKKINYMHVKFSDHYNFKTSDINAIIKMKKNNNYSDALLLTEKDYYRLSENHKNILKKHFKLICAQIEMDFIDNDKSNFNNQLLNFEKSKNKLK